VTVSLNVHFFVLYYRLLRVFGHQVLVLAWLQPSNHWHVASRVTKNMFQ
jgi:hypothetical protein